MTEPKKWTTLGQVVYDMVQEKKTNTPAFQTMLKFWGRSKLRALYLEEKAKRGNIPSSHGGEADGEDRGHEGLPERMETAQDEKEDPWEGLGYTR